MTELVAPDALDGHSLLDDDRLSLSRDMVGRRVFAFDGTLDEAFSLAEALSEEVRGQPVLINEVTDETDDARIVDVYMHRNGQQMSVSNGVEKAPVE
jgi:hypothetical protein